MAIIRMKRNPFAVKEHISKFLLTFVKTYFWHCLKAIRTIHAHRSSSNAALVNVYRKRGFAITTMIAAIDRMNLQHAVRIRVWALAESRALINNAMFVLFRK